MAATTNAANVTVGKPKVGGAIFVAPAGTKLPTDATTALDLAFKGLGFVSEDGLSNENSISVEPTKAWGGEVISYNETEHTDAFKLKLIETLNTEVMKTVHGAENIVGKDLSTGVTIKANGRPTEEQIWVFEMILKGGIAKRIVIPHGKITERGEVLYKDDEVTAYEVTVSAVPDAEGNTHYEYIKGGAAA